jgi:hypothetical protein
MKKIVLNILIVILLINGFVAVSLSNAISLSNITMGEYDMVIIAPNSFSDNIQPLIDHKNNMGIETFLKTTKEIYNEYQGRDKPEQIKYFIKDAIESYNIKYVLLVGGRKGQSFQWYIPERKSNCYTFYGDHGYSTDLYYADIYKWEDDKLVFEDWDSNGNGIFAEWSWEPDGDYDYIDYCPDVYLGRLPCRYEFEVDIVVKKIINYESNSYESSWFKRFIALGNDILVPNPHGDNSGIAEGDVICDVAANYLEPLGFEVLKLYPSDGSFREAADFINAFNQGAGFMLLTAHASPALLKSHRINSTYGLDVFYSFDHMKELINGEKLPIIINCGCHCSQFNVTIMNFLLEMIKYGGYKRYIDSPQYYMYNWVPECIDWWWIRLSEGGAIATIGDTHYGKMELGDTTYYFLNDLNPWIALRFFEIYTNQSIDILGEIHAKSIIDYVNIVGGVNGGARFPPLQRNQVEEWILFGDPSLKIGGYH